MNDLERIQMFVQMEHQLGEQVGHVDGSVAVALNGARANLSDASARLKRVVGDRLVSEALIEQTRDD